MPYNCRPLEALFLEALDALEMEALGGLIVEGPCELFNWKPLEAL
jgi:hypothetical protein